MLESIQDIIKIFAGTSGLYYVIRVHRQAQRQHPFFHYDEYSVPNQAVWRWRKPNAELGLRLEDDVQKSCLYIPSSLLAIEKGCIIAGYLSALFTLYLYALLFVRDAGCPDYLIGGIFVILTLALINVGNRVSSIALYPKHLLLVENYGLFLKRMMIYRHQDLLKFDGKIQSVFQVTVERPEPEFKIYVKSRWCYIFSLKRVFLLTLNQSQGSWLVEGLENWRKNAGLAKVDLLKK